MVKGTISGHRSQPRYDGQSTRNPSSALKWLLKGTVKPKVPCRTRLPYQKRPAMKAAMEAAASAFIVPIAISKYIKAIE